MEGVCDECVLRRRRMQPETFFAVATRREAGRLRGTAQRQVARVELSAGEWNCSCVEFDQSLIQV